MDQLDSQLWQRQHDYDRIGPTAGDDKHGEPHRRYEPSLGLYLGHCPWAITSRDGSCDNYRDTERQHCISVTAVDFLFRISDSHRRCDDAAGISTTTSSVASRASGERRGD